jgi:tRNA dimethylallyltransferase
MRPTLIVLAGPTAVGKTDLSIELARALKTEIISADSRQVYKEMRTGTAVPEPEQLAAVKHHFIRNKSIHNYFSAGKYELEVKEKLKELFKKYDTVILTGGSGMYIDAVCKGIDKIPAPDTEIRKKVINKYETEGIESIRFELKRIDPEFYRQADLNNPKRIMKALEVYYQTGEKYSDLRAGHDKERDFDCLYIILDRERSELYERINRRTDLMFEQGWLEEAKNLLPFSHLNALNTVGYKEIFAYLKGEHSLDRAKELIKRNTRHYAKRQITWFKRYEDAAWFHPTEKDEILNYIRNKI